MLDKLLRNIVPVILGLGILVILTFVFVLVLTGRNPETYIGSISNLVGIFTSSGLLAALLSRIGKNVNGNQSALVDELRKTREAAGITSTTEGVTVQRSDSEYAPPLMSEDTLGRIQGEADRLPSHKA
jgi:hypothetical protein